jgi:glutathione peroxidase
LVVNIASRCGFTSDYFRELKELATRYKEDLEIIAVPSADFMRQETYDERAVLLATAELPFLVTPTSKVNGTRTSALFQILKKIIQVETIPWNFSKFLVDFETQSVLFFTPKVHFIR